jgi:hypothetical protein
MLRETTRGLSSNTGARPVPVAVMLNGLPMALCDTVTVAVRGPIAEGTNVTVMVLLCPATMVSVAGEILNVVSGDIICVIFSVSAPVFCTVSVPEPVLPKGTLPIVIMVADRLMAGCTPAPLSDKTAGDPTALCVIKREADRVPAMVGAKMAVKIWLCPAAIVAVVCETVNASSLDVMLLITKEDCPVLVIVNVFTPVPPTFTLPNESILGEMD